MAGIAMDAAATDTGGAPLAIETNVFRLCELKVVEWRAFQPAVASGGDDVDAIDVVHDWASQCTQSAAQAASSFIPVVQYIQQRAMLYTWASDPATLDADASGDSVQRSSILWIFVVNDAQTLPPDSTIEQLSVISQGRWSADTATDNEPLPVDVRDQLLRALQLQLLQRLVARGELRVVDNEWVVPREAAFIYQCPSLSRMHQLEVYLAETHAMPACRPRVRYISGRSNLVVINVEMVVRRSTENGRARRSTNELGDPRGSWLRLMGLPCDTDHSMVDVWHVDDSIVARTIAETKYADVYPRFRSLLRRRAKKRRTDGSDGGVDGADDGSKTGDELDGDGGDEDGDQDAEDQQQQDGDAEGGMSIGRMARGAAALKKKRKKLRAELSENDESTVPVSPDPHVNSPDGSNSIVRMTFPHDRAVFLHTDSDVKVFKIRQRRRRKRNNYVVKVSLTKQPTHFVTFGSSARPTGARQASPSFLTPASSIVSTPRLSNAQHLRNQHCGNSRRPSPLPTPSTCHTSAIGAGASANSISSASGAPSLAVSLVASLTQDENQEALDTKPVKTHPLLEALDQYVEKEMAASSDASHNDVVLPHAKLVPVDPGFSPSLDRKLMTPTLYVSQHQQQLQMQSALLGSHFQRAFTGYFPRDYKRNKRQHRLEQARQRLIRFKESSLVQYDEEHVAKAVKTTTRTLEIGLGVQLLVADSVTPWRGAPPSRQAVRRCGWTRWNPYAADVSIVRSADVRDRDELASLVTPYLSDLQLVVKPDGRASGETELDDQDEVGEVPKLWMGVEEYLHVLSAPGSDSAPAWIDLPSTPPAVCVSTAEATVSVEIPAISELILRQLHPVGASKPIDYCIVCPHSPAEWLGTLTLSYLACLRSTYNQCGMGDHACIDLSSVEGNPDVSVDSSNAMLLLECAKTSADAFQTYRSAGVLLHGLLRNGAKKKQAFTRSAVSNVVFIVAPFRRTDIRHKTWLLGAFGCGLFGAGDQREALNASWRRSVVLELLFLEDLYDACVDSNPYALLPAAVSLYDRISEEVQLKPIDAQTAAASSNSGQVRHVCERGYCLSDWRRDCSFGQNDDVKIIHAAYVVSSDEKWLLSSFVDPSGSVLETHVVSIEKDAMEQALRQFLDKALEFTALFGVKATLCIVRLQGQFHNESSIVETTAEQEAWQRLRNDPAAPFVPSKFHSVVESIALCQLEFLDPELVQLRTPTATTMISRDRNAVLVVTPDVPSDMRERSRLSNSSWVRSAMPSHQEVVALHLALLDTIPCGDSTNPSSDVLLQAVLADFWALSYLTTHPVTLERHSPLPLHLSVLDNLYSNLETLDRQLHSDPLELR
ncbi:hypothetical protein PINS_up008449 [Pythium insidiosum]|nr:hypothetical protein PINS_up008449 [Pythium insidiosum]